MPCRFQSREDPRDIHKVMSLGVLRVRVHLGAILYYVPEYVLW